MQLKYNFYLLPCLEMPLGHYVIYRDTGEEILVVVMDNQITYSRAALTPAEIDYLNKYVLTN